METQRQFKSHWAGVFSVLICAAALGLFAGFASAAERPGSSASVRYMSRYLRNIPAEQAIAYLAKAGIGTASKFPSSNMLLVTGPPVELIKAKALLGLVDSDQKFVVKTVFPDSQGENLPTNSRIAAVVGDIQIGTFSDPPRAVIDQARAIIDTHKEFVLLIAPADKAESITSAIERLQKQSASPGSPSLAEFAGPQPVETETETAEARDDEFFDKLLDSLAAVEQEAEEAARKAPEPNEVEEVPAAPKEEGLQEADIAAIVKELVAQEVAAKLKSMQQQKPEPAPRAKAEIEPEYPKVETKPEVEAEDEPVAAERAYEPEITYNADEMLELDLPEKLEIADLLRLVGEYLQLDYMYDPDKIKGSVTLKLRGPIKVRDLYPLLESTLKFKGFVMTRKGNLVVIVPTAEVLTIDPDLYTDKRKIEVGEVIITRVFKLKHVDTASATNLLNGMQLGISITPIPATKTLIVTAYTYRMGRIERFLEIIDKAGEPKQFRFRQLKYTMAEVLAPKIKTLAEQLGTISITVATPAARPVAKPKKKPRRPARAAPKPAKPAKPEEPTVYLDADVRTNRILMIGLERQLVIVDELITALDVEQQDLRTLRMYDIQYTGAEDVVDKLSQLGIIGAAPTTTRRPTRARRTTTTKAQTPARLAADTTTQEPTDQPQVVIIESTNSLLVNATAEQHARIATIIGYVDSEQLQTATNYVVYPLENQDPEELGSVLEQLISETITQKDAKDSKIQRTTTTPRIEDEIVIVSDPATYSLIVYASKRNQQWISSLIEQLDEYRAQVLIDVTLVEISKLDAFNYDLDIISAYPDLDFTSGALSSTIGASVVEDILSILESAPDRRRFLEGNITSGEFKGFYGDDKIMALLTAMESKNYGRILNRPKLLVNDNEEGTISLEQVTYREIKTTTIVGTDNPQTSEQIDFRDYSAGIVMTIQPHISKGDQLRLVITLTRSDFNIKEGADPSLPPDTIKNDVSTVVTVPDKNTIILGGLERISQSKGGKKIPILGDIPIIGGLFRTIGNTNEQRKIYIFIKAHILRPGVDNIDLKNISLKNRREFERMETEMQEYEDWPGIKPEPMDPLKILEED